MAAADSTERTNALVSGLSGTSRYTYANWIRMYDPDYRRRDLNLTRMKDITYLFISSHFLTWLRECDTCSKMTPKLTFRGVATEAHSRRHHFKATCHYPASAEEWDQCRRCRNRRHDASVLGCEERTFDSGAGSDKLTASELSYIVQALLMNNEYFAI